MDGNVHSSLHHKTGSDPPVTQSEEEEDEEEGSVFEKRDPRALIRHVTSPKEGPEEDSKTGEGDEDSGVLDGEVAG